MESLTDLRLHEDSWNTALHLVSTPFYGMDEITQFWRLDQSWGQERSVSDYRASANSSDMLTNCLNLFATLVTAFADVDWRNRAVQITQCVMAELQSAEEPQIYLAFLAQFAKLVGNLVDQRKLQDNDPLLFSIWQLLACADEMSTGKLWEPTRMLEDRLGGR
ncbi:hypothetical protein B0T09DRAFT_322824 [Sordaria sp. MPI-SDFR-AT-0083]|nr:hypothetical protein B0T09DRAFT_322824 [Sordaria sp. MPI-SDFR-AT-0083]